MGAPDTDLSSQEGIENELQRLLGLDARLCAVRERAGVVLPRQRPGGFPGMVRVICGQQLSVASAEAIWRRLQASGAAEAPQLFLRHPPEELTATGLSRSKYQAISGLARALLDGELDLAQIAHQDAAQAIASLTQLKGIGPWTAEIYLMFCAGHPDVFPAGDLALRRAVAHALELAPDLAPPELIKIAQLWSPHRSVAAFLFWRYYAAIKNRDAVPV